MYTYTIQNAKPSGETFVIEWNGDTIHGLCGPLSGEEIGQAIRDIQFAPGFEFDPDVAGIDDSPDGWGYPTAVYDPSEHA